MSTYQDYANASSDLLLKRGSAEAHGIASRGQLLGNTIATLGNVIPQQVQEVMRRSAEERKERQIQQIFQQHGGDLPKAIDQIMAIDPDLGMKLGKQYSEAAKSAYEFQTAQHEAQRKAVDWESNVIGAAKDADSYAHALITLKLAGRDVSQYPPEFNPGVVEQANRRLMTAKERLAADTPAEPKVYNLGAGGKLVGADGKVIADNPVEKGTATPSGGFTLSPGQSRYDAAGQPIATAPGRPAGTGAAATLQSRAILGPDGKTSVLANYNPRTGGYTLPDGSPVQNPQPAPSTTARETSEDERKTAGFYTQMQQAISIMNEVEDKLSARELYQIQSLPQEGLIGMANRNELSENAKRYMRAFEQFTEARLRPVSGAAISDSEFARDRRTYAKQYGETAQVNKDRRAARGLALNTLKTRAGRAFQGEDTPTDTGGEWIDAGNGIKIRKK
jgi:hypothetical protein